MWWVCKCCLREPQNAACGKVRLPSVALVTPTPRMRYTPPITARLTRNTPAVADVPPPLPAFGCSVAGKYPDLYRTSPVFICGCWSAPATEKSVHCVLCCVAITVQLWQSEFFTQASQQSDGWSGSGLPSVSVQTYSVLVCSRHGAASAAGGVKAARSSSGAASREPRSGGMAPVADRGTAHALRCCCSAGQLQAGQLQLGGSVNVRIRNPTTGHTETSPRNQTVVRSLPMMRLSQVSRHLSASPVAAKEQTGPKRRVIAAQAGETLASFGPDGEVEWSQAIGQCHDLFILEGGNILTQDGWAHVVEYSPDRASIVCALPLSSLPCPPPSPPLPPLSLLTLASGSRCHPAAAA